MSWTSDDWGTPEFRSWGKKPEEPHWSTKVVRTTLRDIAKFYPALGMSMNEQIGNMTFMDAVTNKKLPSGVRNVLEDRTSVMGHVCTFEEAMMKARTLTLFKIAYGDEGEKKFQAFPYDKEKFAKLGNLSPVMFAMKGDFSCLE